MVKVIANARTTTKQKVELISPKKAELLLAHNDCRRPLRTQEVDRKARDMVAGHWRYTGESIKVSTPDEEGNEWLLDGQHRLNAVVSANIELPFLVVRGLEREAGAVMDSGIPRTPGDALYGAGFTYTVRLAAVARLVLSDGGGIYYRPTKSEILQVVQNDSDLVWAVETGTMKHPGLLKLMSPSVYCYAYWKLYKIDPEACEQFFTQLDELTDLQKGSPVLALHKALTRHERRGDGVRSRRESLSFIYQGWNAWRSDETRDLIRVYRRSNGELIVPEPI